MNKPVDDPDVMTVWLTVYKNFMEAVDAIDNGVNQYDTDKPARYSQNSTLSSRVGNLNPAWNIPHGNAELDQLFLKAMDLTGQEFLASLRYTIDAWLPGRSLVKESLEGCPSVHPSGALFIQCCFFSRIVAWVTPKNIHFYFKKKHMYRMNVSKEKECRKNTVFILLTFLNV